MNNKTDIDVKYVSPLKKICMTIGELPASYLETMSYYEMLVWFVEFLKNQIIPIVNNNAEAVSELQALYEELRQYVNNYFDNLDVQDEINNKLDNMLESGQLDSVIQQFLQSNAMWSYDTVADMKVATNLVNGSIAKTLGYHSINDGGGAFYIITNTQDSNNHQEILDSGLYATLIHNHIINPKQLGAYGDNTHDDSEAFKEAFKLISLDNFYDSNVVSDHVTNLIMEIPNATYLIQSADLFEDMGSTPIFNILINGNYSRLVFDGFNGNAFNNNNLLAGIVFNNTIFSSSNDSNERILFNSYSTGKAQNMKFNNCNFAGNWKYVFNLTGTNNNSEFLFNECSMGGIWDSFLYTDEDLASDQFLNYWFNNCRYWSSYNWIHMEKGGHVKLNNCDISGYQPSSETYLYELGQGSVAQGVSVFIDEGSRYELKTANAKVLKYHWDNGLIHFDNVDMSSQWGNGQIDKCFDIETSTHRDLIRFSNSKIYGEFYLHTSANVYPRAEIVIDNCQISKTIGSIVEFYTPYTYAPTLKIVNSTFSDDTSYTIINITLKNIEYYSGNVFTRKIYSYNPNGSTSATIKKYYKPYYIEMVAFGKDPRAYDNNTTIKVKCLLGKITEVSNTTNIKVSENDFIHFRKGMTIEIGSTSNTIVSTNFGSKNVGLQTADSSMQVGDDVYIILFNHQSNAYYGQEVNEERCHWLLYNDLLYEATAASVGQMLFEVIE